MHSNLIFSNPRLVAKLDFYFWLAVFIVFGGGFFASAFIFGFLYHNPWAVVGFAIATLFIVIRIVIHITPVEVLFRIFKPASVTRALFQTIFLMFGLAGIALGIWLLWRGLHRHEQWNGESDFCGMTAIWMGGKWAFFVTKPIYELRADTIDPALFEKLSLQGDLGFREEV